MVSHEEIMAAKQSHTDFYLHYNCQKLYNCSYERHIVNIIDDLTARSDNEILDTHVHGVDVGHVTTDLQPCANTNTNNNLSSIPPNIRAHIPMTPQTLRLTVTLASLEKDLVT